MNKTQKRNADEPQINQLSKVRHSKTIAQAIKKYGAQTLLPPGIGRSNLTNQVDWLTHQMVAVANILNLPEDKTLEDLAAHALALLMEIKK